MGAAYARIVLWGIEGAGKSTTLRTIHARLRPESRGELVRVPTRLDPTIYSETLAISLGEMGGRPMQIEIVSVPGADDQAMTRKQLLDEVDGVILVLDCAPGRIEANATAIDELRSSSIAVALASIRPGAQSRTRITPSTSSRSCLRVIAWSSAPGTDTISICIGLPPISPREMARVSE